RPDLVPHPQGGALVSGGQVPPDGVPGPGRDRERGRQDRQRVHQVGRFRAGGQPRARAGQRLGVGHRGHRAHRRVRGGPLGPGRRALRCGRRLDSPRHRGPRAGDAAPASARADPRVPGAGALPIAARRVMPAPARRAAGARLRRTGAALGLAGLAFVAVATLTPLRNAHGTALTPPVLCLVCGAQGGADIAANLLLFLPLAVGIRLAGASWGRTVLLCALLSFTVELLQYTVVPGREASLSDLLTNTTSGAIGAAAGGHVPAALRPRPRQAAALLGVGTSALTAALGISAWLLQSRLPEGELYSLWAPSHEVFEGQVTSVSLEGRPMPRGGAPPDSAELRRRLERGGFTLAVDVTSGSPTQDREPIYMFRGPSRSALILSQLRREAAVAVPARALRYRLWPPMLSLADGLPAGPGVPVRLTAVEQERRLRL